MALKRLYFATIFLLIFCLELLLIFNSESLITYGIAILHTAFLAAGLIMISKEDIKSIFFLEAAVLKKEPITREFANEVLYSFAKVLIVFPSVLLHLAGALLLMPSLRSWVLSSLLSKNVI